MGHAPEHFGWTGPFAIELNTYANFTCPSQTDFFSRCRRKKFLHPLVLPRKLHTCVTFKVTIMACGALQILDFDDNICTIQNTVSSWVYGPNAMEAVQRISLYVDSRGREWKEFRCIMWLDIESGIWSITTALSCLGSRWSKSHPCQLFLVQNNLLRHHRYFVSLIITRG